MTARFLARQVGQGVAVAVVWALVWAGCKPGPLAGECPDGLLCPEDQACAAAQNICIAGICGDGVVDPGEQCDDGNVRGGDACPADCVCGSPWQPVDADAGWHLSRIAGSGPDNLYAVGISGRLPLALTFDSLVAEPGVIVHSDGHRFSVVHRSPAALFGVWVAPGGQVFVAGAGGVILRQNGVAWEAMDSGTDRDLFAIWGQAADSVYAVGAGGTILHYNGVGWSAMESGEDGILIGVWGLASGDVFAFGEFGLILRYNPARGSAWERMVVAEPQNRVDMWSMWGTGLDNLWAGGNEHRVFRLVPCAGCDPEWRQVARLDADNEAPILGMSGTGPDDVIAVAPAPIHTRGVVWRFDGSDWTAAEAGSTLIGVVATSPQDTFAVGLLGTILHQHRAAMVPVSLEAAAAGASISAVWVEQGGERGYAVAGGRLLLRDAAGWTRPDLPAGTDSGVLLDVWASRSGDVVAVGKAGLLLHYRAALGRWSVVAPGLDEDLRAVWGSDATGEVLVTGARGTVVRYDGQGTWAPMDSGTNAPLTGVWMAADNTGFAVGPGGTVLIHRPQSHGAWRPMVLRSFDEWAPLTAVWGASPRDVFAVGQNGEIFHYDGNPENAWELMPSCTTRPLLRIWGTGPERVYAVGEQGTVVHYNGRFWAPVYPDTRKRIRAVHGTPDGGRVLLAGDKGWARDLQAPW